MKAFDRPPQPLTRFAPAGREGDERVRLQAGLVAAAPFLTDALDCVNETVVIVNARRQIVYANRRFAGRKDDGVHQVYHGLRPGEAIGCIHALSGDAPDGCGTTEFCSTCGAVRAVLQSQKTGSGLHECSILVAGRAEALNLRVRANQVAVDDETFTVCAMEDVSASKRREELERVFFHDIINTAGAVKGLAELLEVAPEDKHRDFARSIAAGAQRLVDEISSHRVILAAERGELSVDPQPVEALDALHQAMALMAHHECASTRRLIVAPKPERAEFRTDPGLLSRVLVNMIKNALEATPAGGVVNLSCRKSDTAIAFQVHNDSFMPQEVATQVFRRSYSTKGRGRGLGTFGMRLITERYLGGSVSFSTSKAEGTTFTALYPRSLPVQLPMRIAS